MKGLLFTYVLTFGGALISLFNPFVGLLIYICFAIVSPRTMWYWSVPRWHYSRIVAIALLAGWALKGFGCWQLGRGRGIVLALLGFWLWSVLGAAQAPDQEVAWTFVESLSKAVLPFLVGITTIDSLHKLRQVVWVILLSQGYVAFELNLSYLQGFNRVHEIGHGGMDNNAVAIAMVTSMGLAFFCGLHSQGWWRKALAFGSAALMGHTVLLTFSRGGMLALIITGVVAFVFVARRPKHFVALALAVLLGIWLAGPQVSERFMTIFADPAERDPSAQSRLDLWANCWDAMLRQPVFGIGPDHWPLVVHQYGWVPGKHAHTLWLSIGAELGFPGLLCLGLFYGLCVARLWPLAREQGPVPDPWFGYFARMVIASLIGFAVSAQFVSLPGLELPYYITLVGAGALKLSSVASPIFVDSSAAKENVIATRFA